MAEQAPQNVTRIQTKRAGATIAAYRILKFGADSEHVIHASAATSLFVGVSRPGQGADPSDMVLEDHPCDYAAQGIAHVEYGGTVTAGALLTSDADGKAVAASSGNQVIGTAQIAGVDGDIGAVEIARSIM